MDCGAIRGTVTGVRADPGLNPGDQLADLPRVALLEREPALLRHLPESEAARARGAARAPVCVLEPGGFVPADVLARGSNAFAGLVLSGLISREVSAGGQPTLCLLGPGDLIHPGELDAGLLVVDQVWACSVPAEVALLDDRFLWAVRRFPRLLIALAERAFEGHDATLVQLAISQQTRVEERLVALFSAMAERWGRMTPEGVLVPLSLTHEALGRLIGARRPTVTLALRTLAKERRLERVAGGSWLLQDGSATRSP